MNIQWTAHPPAPGESTVTKPSEPSGGEPMELEPDVRRRMRGKTQKVSTDQPIAPSSSVITDTVQRDLETSKDEIV